MANADSTMSAAPVSPAESSLSSRTTHELALLTTLEFERQQRPAEDILQVLFSSDARLFTLSSIGRFRVFDLPSGRLLAERAPGAFNGQLRSPNAMCMAGPSQGLSEALVVLDCDFDAPEDRLHVLRLENLQSVRTGTHAPGGPNRAVRFARTSLASNGSMLFVATRACVFCYSVEHLRLLGTIRVRAGNPPADPCQLSHCVSLVADRLLYVQQATDRQQWLRYVSVAGLELERESEPTHADTTAAVSEARPFTTGSGSVQPRPQTVLQQQAVVLTVSPVNVCALKVGSGAGELLSVHALISDLTRSRLLLSDIDNNRVVSLSLQDGRYLECWPAESVQLEPPSALTDDWRNGQRQLLASPTCIAMRHDWLVVEDPDRQQLKLFQIQLLPPLPAPTVTSANHAFAPQEPMTSVREALAAAKVPVPAAADSAPHALPDYRSSSTPTTTSVSLATGSVLHYTLLVWAMDCPQFVLLRVQGNEQVLEVLTARLFAEAVCEPGLFEYAWINRVTGVDGAPLTWLQLRHLRFGHAPVLRNVWSEGEARDYLRTRFSVAAHLFDEWLANQEQQRSVLWLRENVDAAPLREANGVIAMMMKLTSQ